MEKIRVWTRQNTAVLNNILNHGRHVAKKKYVHDNEDAMSMITAYDWLVRYLSERGGRPADADYPIWVSMKKETTTIPVPGTVLLELEVNVEKITYLNVAKWGMINNFSYIPLNEEDEKRHKALMKAYGISDAKAYMSRFYPEIKQEIEKSWARVFDDHIKIGNEHAYGLIWEIKKEELISF